MEVHSWLVFQVLIYQEKNVSKSVLTYIYGIGRTSANRILAEAGVNPDTRVKDLTDDEVKNIAAVDAETQVVEGDLRRERQL